MMGDGLHYESDGKWIIKEYRQLRKILCPPTPEMKEIERQQRKERAIRINEQIDKLLEKSKCSCGGNLKQKKSGTKVAYCELCNSRYVAKYKK